MYVKVTENPKLVEVWLTRAERRDPALRSQLQEQCRPFAEENYTVVYFSSGAADLYDQTLELLRYNKVRSAQRSVQAQQQVQVS